MSLPVPCSAESRLTQSLFSRVFHQTAEDTAGTHRKPKVLGSLGRNSTEAAWGALQAPPESLSPPASASSFWKPHAAVPTSFKIEII